MRVDFTPHVKSIISTLHTKTINFIIITVYDLDIQEISSVMGDVLLACKYLVGKPECK